MNKDKIQELLSNLKSIDKLNKVYINKLIENSKDNTIALKELHNELEVESDIDDFFSHDPNHVYWYDKI